MGNQGVEVRCKIFSEHMMYYASNEQRIRKGRPSDSVFPFNWPNLDYISLNDHSQEVAPFTGSRKF